MKDTLFLLQTIGFLALLTIKESSQVQLGLVETLEDSELPSHRRTTRISRISLNDRNLLDRAVQKRENQFDQLGATKDDILIENFWRQYGAALETDKANVELVALETEFVSDTLDEIKAPETKDETEEGFKSVGTQTDDTETIEETTNNAEVDSSTTSQSKSDSDAAAARFSGRSESGDPHQEQRPVAPSKPSSLPRNPPVKRPSLPPPRYPYAYPPPPPPPYYPYPPPRFSMYPESNPNLPYGYAPMPMYPPPPRPTRPYGGYAPYVIPSPANDMQASTPPNYPVNYQSSEKTPSENQDKTMPFIRGGLPQPSYPMNPPN